MNKEQFGKKPSGNRLERLKLSPHYHNRQFHNLEPTPQLSEKTSMWSVMTDRLFKKNARLKPEKSIPSIKTNLHNLDPQKNLLIWFGHSSYFIQLNGKRFLIDPILNDHASPVPGMVKAFKGTNIYQPDDFPDIDYLLITHDHYDHLDFKTVTALQPKINHVVCGLGVGEHFEYWGYLPEQIIENDWFEKVNIDTKFELIMTPTRHFSGRSIHRNNTLWGSYILKTPSYKMYLGGDSGYGKHYKQIGNQFGPFDFAILENGQYNKAWPYIHEMPHQVLEAAKDLQAKRILPVHSSKFALSTHPWDEPLEKITHLNQTLNIQLATPIIGEIVYLDQPNQAFKRWWRY